MAQEEEGGPRCLTPKVLQSMEWKSWRGDSLWADVNILEFMGHSFPPDGNMNLEAIVDYGIENLLDHVPGQPLTKVQQLWKLFLAERGICRPVTFTILPFSLNKQGRSRQDAECWHNKKLPYKTTSLHKVIIAIVLRGTGRGQMNYHDFILPVL